MAVNFTWPAKVSATGPRRTETLPLYVSLSTTPVSSAPGMQGAMRGMSIKVFHASLGGSGTSKLLLISMNFPMRFRAAGKPSAPQREVLHPHRDDQSTECRWADRSVRDGWEALWW